MYWKRYVYLCIAADINGPQIFCMKAIFFKSKMHGNQTPTTSSTTMQDSAASSSEVAVVQAEEATATTTTTTSPTCQSPVLVVGEVSTNNLELIPSNQPEQSPETAEVSGNKKKLILLMLLLLCTTSTKLARGNKGEKKGGESKGRGGSTHTCASKEHSSLLSLSRLPHLYIHVYLHT